MLVFIDLDLFGPASAYSLSCELEPCELEPKPAEDGLYRFGFGPAAA